MSEGFWHERDTSASAIAGALGALLREGHEDGTAHSPARALNLVVVLDAEWRGEIANRLEAVGRSHPSRTIVFEVERDRDALEAKVWMSCAEGGAGGAPAPCREQIEISVGSGQLSRLESIAAPNLLSDLPTVVWAPHRHEEAVSSLLDVADAVLVDTLEEPSVERAIRGASALAERTHVVDLTWIRGAPWRERIADLFDPGDWQRALAEISRIELRHAAGSGMASLLLVGWLGSRLGWKPRPLLPHEGTLYAKLRGRRQHVEVRLSRAEQHAEPGLDSVEILTASEATLSLARRPGGFRARRRAPREDEREWTVLGAPLGEHEVLGEGIREALLRDRVYEDALDLSAALLPEETLL